MHVYTRNLRWILQKCLFKEVSRYKILNETNSDEILLSYACKEIVIKMDLHVAWPFLKQALDVERRV